MKIKLLLIPLLAILLYLPANAQKVALKSNLLYDAILSPNLGIEIGLAPRWTLDLSGNVNLWT
ncbi:MAG: DUF3575 domain-containing protein, partial [Muribaculaceae bacterium]|nr:DUF3575 domain-containing protein [Muribaculaceae bacterium]